MKNNKITRLCAGVMAVGMILTSTAFAASAVSAATTAKTPISISQAAASEISKIKQEIFGKWTGEKKEHAKAEPKAGLTAELKAAVTAKIITQAESDKIQAFVTDKKAAPKMDLLKALVKKDILTQAKADAFKASFEAQREVKVQAALKAVLGKLVTKKTITQAQADKIITALNAADKARKAAFDKAATMSKADAKAYLDKFRKTDVNPLKTLVKAGTITQAQADKVGKILHQGRGTMQGMGREGGKGPADNRGLQGGKGPMSRNGRGCK